MFEITDLTHIIIPMAVVLVGLSLGITLLTIIAGCVQVAKGKMKPQDLFLLLKAPTVYLMRQTQAPSRQGQTKQLRFDRSMTEKYRRQARMYKYN
jgi:hypothetical protein